MNTKKLNGILFVSSVIMCLMVLSNYNQSSDKIYSILYSANGIFAAIDNSEVTVEVTAQSDNNMTQISPGLYSLSFTDESGTSIGYVLISSGDKMYLKSNLSNGNCIYYAFEFKNNNWILIGKEVSESENKKEGY